MAPRTRSMVKLERAPFRNSRGFARLPRELLQQILSYMQEAVIPWIYEGAMQHWYSERRDLLRTLCQLDRCLRAVFLPLLWERLEACTYTVEAQKRAWGYKYDPWLANHLPRQLELVMNRKLRYAQYVRVVSVAVFRSDLADAILKKLARALSFMPNVHTIQIICPSRPTSDTPRPLVEPGQFQKAFEGYIYPSVRHVVLPHQARMTFACFPQAQHVVMNQRHVSDHHAFSDTVEEVAKYCRAIESFGWVEELWEARVNSIVTMLPRLRRLEYHILCGKPDEVTELSKLQNLKQIMLCFSKHIMNCDEVGEIIEEARGVLGESQLSQGNKRLIVMFDTWLEL